MIENGVDDILHIRVQVLSFLQDLPQIVDPGILFLLSFVSLQLVNIKYNQITLKCTHRALSWIPARSSLLAVSLSFRHTRIVLLVLVTEEVLETVDTSELVTVSTLLLIMFLNIGLLQLFATSITGEVNHDQ